VWRDFFRGTEALGRSPSSAFRRSTDADIVIILQSLAGLAGSAMSGRLFVDIAQVRKSIKPRHAFAGKKKTISFRGVHGDKMRVMLCYEKISFKLMKLCA
jgi:hypothetical protein